MKDLDQSSPLAAPPNDYEPPETTEDPEPIDEPVGDDGYPIKGGETVMLQQDSAAVNP